MKLIILFFSLLSTLSAYAQYGGQYGGQSGGYGRQSMGGMNQPMDNYRPSAFNSIPTILADRETKWLRDSLSLSKEQTKLVKKLNFDYAKQQQDAIKDIVGTKGDQPSPATVKQVREAMTMLNDEKQDMLKPLLTPEQWIAYQARKLDMWKQTGGFYEKGLVKVN
ncbi:MAG: hypothetical protein LH609_19265 [Rudanella sp.]|nr:hypothetical protein [Rudanella sp.]